MRGKQPEPPPIASPRAASPSIISPLHSKLVIENPHKNLPYFLKGQMHAHSKPQKDGDRIARELGCMYRNGFGYAFLAITDHAVGQMPTEDPRVPGLLHILSMEDGYRHDHHMGVVGIDTTKEDTSICPDNDHNGICDLGTGDCANVQPRVDFYNSQGAISTLNHPYYKRYHQSDQKNRTGYTAVEVWNANTDPLDFVNWWDGALSYGHKSFAIAADDYEKIGQRMSGGWINVNSTLEPGAIASKLESCLNNDNAGYLSYRASCVQDIMQNIKAGNFFAVVRPDASGDTCYPYSRDPGPKITLTTRGRSVTIAVAADMYERLNAFTVTPVVMPWLSSAPARRPAIPASESITLDLNDYTGSAPHAYRYIRFEIDQRRHSERFRAYSQPLYIRFYGIPIPSGFKDYDYEFRDWLATKLSCAMSVSPCQINSGDEIGLFNNYNKTWMKYGASQHGIDLVWTNTTDSTVHFFRNGGSGPLKYGDALSLCVAGGGYVRYAEREEGINLVWSAAPVYEWVITGGTVGQPIYDHQPFGLRNTTINNEVVYCARDRGINLKWRKDCSAADKGR